MIDIVSDACVNSFALTFVTAGKDELFAQFMDPLEDDETGRIIAHTREQADAALAFLAEQDLVVIEGDRVSIPPRFVAEFDHPPAQL